MRQSKNPNICKIKPKVIVSKIKFDIIPMVANKSPKIINI